ncbi:MAG: right-handed parallel beta-helix repeat-containing protein [Flavobacteriales bacterium]|nr:right-handed parallel beta-helix repeat-containing protein [Flavobacteriales bacterium]
MLPSFAQTMVTKYLYEFDTLGSGHPNDLINDQLALLKAAAFFQARGGYGTLILEDGEYIVGRQELHWAGDPLPGPDWTAFNYPSGGVAISCPALVAIQPGFALHDCAQFTVQGGANTTVRYRDCLYYGTFLRTPGTDEVFSAAGVDACKTCTDTLHLPGLLHANVGVMFSFHHCDSITVRDVELNGNIDGAILGGKSSRDGIQTDYDGIELFESSNCVIDHVDAHHFGRDGLLLWGNSDSTNLFTAMYPGLNVGIDPADSLLGPNNRTVLFNNRVLNSSFNWNGRQGISWTAMSGLDVLDCDLNYNGAGRMTSQPRSGLDIEGGGGPMRVRHGAFADCRFLHNRSHGIVSAWAACYGQQDFRFTRCVVKAGLEGLAIWPGARQMVFDSCEVYGNVGRFFEQPENIVRDPAFDLVFRHTNFHEEDAQWSYISWTIYGLHDTTVACVAGPHMFRFTKAHSSRVTFDQCGFYTNCRAVVRFYGRDTAYAGFPYCPECDTCAVSGPCLTCTQQDDRYVRVLDCEFINTGRNGCGSLTEVFSGEHTLVDSLTTFSIPANVRGGVPGDLYEVDFSACAPYCSGYTVNTIPTTVFPACKPFFFLQDTVVHWDFCDTTNNVLVQHCFSDASCYSNRVIPDSALASVVGTVFNGTVNIQGRFFVDVDVSFYNAQVYMDAGAEIIVQNGRTLDIDNSSFAACNGIMWKSITAENGSTVRIWDAFMDDAESAIAALDGSVVWVDGTQFHNNRVGIGIPDVGGTYNNVACWVSNSTFYSAGPMPQPYPGQTTAVGARGFAAVEVYNTTFDFTGGNNIIHSLSNGMVAHRSDLNVSGCQMLNIQPDAAYPSHWNGAGIYANGSSSWSTLQQQGFGMNASPSFWDCRWGIYTEYMNVYTTDNHMVEMGTAYRIDRSGYRSVDILYNKVHTKFNGIDLRANDGAGGLLVQYNDVTFGDSPCTGCKAFTAIFVSEGNYANPASRILNNTIHFLPLAASRSGISLTAADRWLVAENEVIMADNALNFSGIQLTGCRRTEVSCNTVTGASTTSFPVDGQSAIRNMMGSQPLISCNEMDKTANGILFNGVAYGTDVRGNFFHSHKWPLHLDATAIIDVQAAKGNLWDTAAAVPVWGAWYENTFNALANPFLYNAAMIGGGNTQPPSWSPSGWFQPTSDPNYDCADHHGMDYCNQFGEEREQERIRSLDEQIASDSLENYPYTEETQWILVGDLYKKLDDTPELLDSIPTLEDFYNDLQGSTTAAFKAINDDQLALYDLDSTVIAQLQANREQIESLIVLVKDGLEQLGDSTLTTAQRQAILASISGYSQSIRDLNEWNTTALQVASASKVLTADGVKAANAGIATSEMIEANEKTVNEIYLATIGKDVDDFTSTQADDLFTIANQCPMLGGNAVFKARSLYWLIDDTQDFDDALLCLPHGIVVKSLVEQQTNAVRVVPNPVSDEANLLLAQESVRPAYLTMYNTVGSEVLRVLVPKGVVRHAFSTASIASGLYHFKVLSGDGLLGDGKLTIVR